MAFKPNFCCVCGDKIERAEWSWTASRRFCDVCETNFRHLDWTPRIVLVVGLILTIASLGVFLKKPEKSLIVSSANQPLNFTSNANRSANSQTDSRQANFDSTNFQTANGGGAQPKTDAVAAAKPIEKTKSPETQPTAAAWADEKIYFCGARTKKGTPCTRRVKGGGRCWQHVGQPAMLPPEKLIAN